MALAIGFIFKDYFKSRIASDGDPEPLKQLRSSIKSRGMKGFFYSALIVGGSILVHELSHKFTAFGFGLGATFHASYTWLGLGVLLKLMSGFVFFVPAYVSITGSASPSAHALISFAGPLVHGVFYLASYYALRSLTLSKKQSSLLALFKKVNGFLFILNMLPIPGFDGFKVYSGLLTILF